MNKQVLSPFDCDMCAMIEDITKQSVEVTASDTSIRLSWAQNGSEGDDKPEAQRIEALKQAIRGRLGDRFMEFFYANGKQSVYMKHDPTEYPEEMRDFLFAIDPEAGQRYCRTLQEVNAIQVEREKLEELKAFTGGGMLTIPREPNARAIYTFPNGNGMLVDVPETFFIVRDDANDFTTMHPKEFARLYEPKGDIKIAPIPNILPNQYDVQRLFSELFGNDIQSRCRKLTEEYNEFMEAVPEIFGKNIAQCTDKQLAKTIDELADINGVIFHIAGILGLTQWELVLLAYDKVKGRQIDPNYKRTHPHEVNNGCGDCANFTNENVNGNGYCEAFKSEQSCGTCRCQEYKPKN